MVCKSVCVFLCKQYILVAGWFFFGCFIHECIMNFMLGVHSRMNIFRSQFYNGTVILLSFSPATSTRELFVCSLIKSNFVDMPAALCVSIFEAASDLLISKRIGNELEHLATQRSATRENMLLKKYFRNRYCAATSTIRYCFPVSCTNANRRISQKWKTVHPTRKCFHSNKTVWNKNKQFGASVCN